MHGTRGDRAGPGIRSKFLEPVPEPVGPVPKFLELISESAGTGSGTGYPVPCKIHFFKNLK